MNSKSKKILYIITKSVWAGAGKYVFDLATGLPKDSFDVAVAAGGRDVLAQKIIDEGIKYHEIKSFQRNMNPLRDIAALIEVTGLIFEIKPEVVHVSSAKAGGVAGLAIFIYSMAVKILGLANKILLFFRSKKTIRIFNRPHAIFTAHGWTFGERRPHYQIFLIKVLSQITCLFYDKIICVSEHDRKIAIGNKIAPARKLVTIHNGIRPDYYKFYSRTEAREKLNLDEKDFVVGAIGEFTKNKGHRYLIEAAENLKNIKFVIIGFGEKEEYLRNKIKEIKIEDRFFVETKRPDAAFYLKAFDVFVLTSLKEGLPYVLMEAGLAGLPIIATNVGGIPEIISTQETGILNEPMAPYELEGNIERLYKNSDFANNLGEGAKEKILKEFTFERMLTDTVSLY